MMTTRTRMTLDRTLEDIYSYQKQALDLLDEDHPHYEEIKVLLTEQINDEIGQIYANSQPDQGAS